MLSKLESTIVNEQKIYNFGAYLQWAFIVYGDLHAIIAKEIYPQQAELRKLIEEMNYYFFEFNEVYLVSLPQEKCNPLQIEQEAWRLLSPKIKSHLGEFGEYLDGYDPDTSNLAQLLSHLNEGWDLIQKWDIISNSYKPKDQESWDKLEMAESKARELIGELKSCY